MWRLAAGWLATLVSAPLLLLAAAATALDDDALGFERTPPRLAFVDGAVSFFRSDADGWTPARVNIALAAGDSLATAEAANLELQAGPRTWLRAGELTNLALVALEPDFLSVRLDAGTLALDLRELTPGQTFELATPHGVFRIEQAGYYRAGVLDDVTTFSSRRGGVATAIAGGTRVPVASGEQLVLHGGDAPRSETYASPELDAWDRWNYARTEAQLEPESARYVPADVYGASDLDSYGDWRTDASYGSVWVPSSVPAGWVPYSDGYWQSDPYYGQTWVDYSPWGWAPFHYGRWVYTSGFWGWCPGPRLAHAYYSPALVAFSGGSDFFVGVGVSSFSWVALGWGEPLYPWWGPSHFRGHRHWAGWSGPRHGHWDDWDHGGHHDGGHHGGGHDGGGHHGDWDRDHGRGDHDGRGHDGRWDNDRHRDLRNYRNAGVRDGVVTRDRRDFARRSDPGDRGRDGRDARDRRDGRDGRRDFAGRDPQRGPGGGQPQQRDARRGRGDGERGTPPAGFAPRDERRPRVEPERTARRGRDRDRGAERRTPAPPGQSVRRPPGERGEIVRENPPASPRRDGVERREQPRRSGQPGDVARARPERERADRGRRDQGQAQRTQRPQPPVASAPPQGRIERREQPRMERRESPRMQRRQQMARVERREVQAPPRQPDPPRAREVQRDSSSNRGNGGMGAVTRGDGGNRGDGGGNRAQRADRGDRGSRGDGGGGGWRDGGGGDGGRGEGRRSGRH